MDPYYLVYKAKELGYYPQVILAGRAINDYMPKHVAEITIKSLNEVGKVVQASRVLIMGLTYKEDVADTRETPVKGIIKELRDYGVDIYGFDPLLASAEDEFEIKVVRNLAEAPKVDGVILTVGHNAFKEATLDRLKSIMNAKPVLIDVRGFFDKKQAGEKGFYYRTL